MLPPTERDFIAHLYNTTRSANLAPESETFYIMDAGTCAALGPCAGCARLRFN